MLSYLPLPKLHISFISRKEEGKIMICLGKEANTNLSDKKQSFEEQSYIYIFIIKQNPSF